MKIFIGLTFFLIANVANAAVQCEGKIKNIYKWDYFETISILLNIEGQGATRWISMPTKSDESMALMAFAAQKDVVIYMSEDTVTSCINGWSHNKKLKGYFVLSN